MASPGHLLRDPLVHFLLGGVLLFLVYDRVAGGAEPRPDRIVVSEARVASLAETFQRTWMRPPTAQELRGLVDDYVMEEILYREALALGLDRDDLIVRRRMRQKMEFLTEELSDGEPSERQLAAFLQENPRPFRVPQRTSFVQLFVDPERPAAEAHARELLATLRGEEATGDGSALGDATLLPRSLHRATPADVASQFGESFARALADLPEGRWSGPVTSSLGVHLVRIDAREPARTPSLDEVRDAVAREWSAQRREEARRRFQDSLRERYEVVLPELPGIDAAELAASE